MIELKDKDGVTWCVHLEHGDWEVIQRLGGLYLHYGGKHRIPDVEIRGAKSLIKVRHVVAYRAGMNINFEIESAQFYPDDHFIDLTPNNLYENPTIRYEGRAEAIKLYIEQGIKPTRSIKPVKAKGWGVFNRQGWFTGHEYDNEEQAKAKASRSTGCYAKPIFDEV